MVDRVVYPDLPTLKIYWQELLRFQVLVILCSWYFGLAHYGSVMKPSWYSSTTDTRGSGVGGSHSLQKANTHDWEGD